MTNITGSKIFNNYESALKLYNKLDKAGYNVSLSACSKNMYTVSYMGYTETIPMKKIER